MIQSRPLLFISLSLICLAAILSWPFPDNPETGMSSAVFNIPITTDQGFAWIGIMNVIILLAGLFLLASALKTHRLLAGIAALLVFSFVPPALTEIYQTTLATGIYAISANIEESQCEFTREEDWDDLVGVCRVNFTNHSREEVTFHLLFNDRYDGSKMVSLMNINGPHTITLPPHGRTTIEFEETIDTRNIPNAIHSGSATGLQFKIFVEDKVRNM